MDKSKRRQFLTHYQTTNFRLFQTKGACRRQFQIWRQWQKVIQTGRKRCGKRRNCLLWAISPFPSVFERLVSQKLQKVSMCGNGLTLSQTTEFWTWPNWKHLQTTSWMLLKWWIIFWIEKKTLWEKEKMLVTSIFSFSHSVFKRLVL